MGDDVGERGEHLGAELVVAGALDMATDGVQVPHGGVDGVVLGAADVGGVGQHPL